MNYYELAKTNSTFSGTDTLKDYIINNNWSTEYNSLWELVSGSSEQILSTFYEHIANYVQNIRDIDTCGIHQLNSIANELDVSNLFLYNTIEYPVELSNLIDILSTNRSFLLTSGYILNNTTLDNLYSDTVLSDVINTVATDKFSGPSAWIQLTGYLTGSTGTRILSSFFNSTQIHALSSQTVIPDNNYISFIENSISGLLLQCSQYEDDRVIYPVLSSNPEYIRANEYIAFMENMYASYPTLTWNSGTSSTIIEECSHTLRNVCIRTSYQRETLKTIAQKHAMIGTNKALTKILSEYILRSYTKQTDWRYYIEPSGSLKSVTTNNAYKLEQLVPSLSAISNYFNIEVIEYYDTTQYMNISAASQPLCGIIGYNTITQVLSSIDLSGNILTSNISAQSPIYDNTGLCGFVVTGGNPRYWEGDQLTYSINNSDTTSAEISSFYYNLGLDDQPLSSIMIMNNTIWNAFAPSGMNRLAVIPDLTGIPLDRYKNASYIPADGWSVSPASLSSIHYKYLGTSAGIAPAANITNTKYPTMATNPFLWNMVEKAYEYFPTLVRTLLFTQQEEASHYNQQVDNNGNLVDSWKYFNREYTGYQTYYEYSDNYDITETMNPEIDRDGSFSVNALSTYLTSTNPSGDLLDKYYKLTSKNFSMSGCIPRIDKQLRIFKDQITSLSGYHIYQYAFDTLDNHYMLYKTDNEFETLGSIWMRFKSHPIPFPLAYNTTSITGSANLTGEWSLLNDTLSYSSLSGYMINHEIQQMYCKNNSISNLDYIFTGHTYDFGIYDTTAWVVGKKENGDDVLVIYQYDNIDITSPITTNRLSIVVDASKDAHLGYQRVPIEINLGSINNYVGSYLYNDYIIFVTVEQWLSSTSVQFRFSWFNRYSYKIETTPFDYITVSNLPTTIYNTTEKLWQISSSNEFIHIMYEAINTNVNSDYVNSIVSIDMPIDSLNTFSNQIIINQWTMFI